ncbi:MAG: DMT family transporter, partial [Rhodospirillaceae bacterium]|nr:DMT family transporter [Rhodospirillaceae bacterium]
GILIAATVVMLPASMLADQPWTLNYTFETLAAAMYLGIFPTALATIFLIEIIAARGVTFLSLNNYLIPALGVLWGVLFLGETVTSGAIGGLALILVGIAVAGIGPATVQEEIEQQQDAEAEYRDQA